MCKMPTKEERDRQAIKELVWAAIEGDEDAIDALRNAVYNWKLARSVSAARHEPQHYEPVAASKVKIIDPFYEH